MALGFHKMLVKWLAVGTFLTCWRSLSSYFVGGRC